MRAPTCLVTRSCPWVGVPAETGLSRGCVKRGQAAGLPEAPVTQPRIPSCFAVTSAQPTCLGTLEPIVMKLLRLGFPSREARSRALPSFRFPGAGRGPPQPGAPLRLPADQAAPPPLSRVRHVTATTRGRPANQRAPGAQPGERLDGPIRDLRSAVRHRPNTARRGQSAGAKARPR